MPQPAHKTIYIAGPIEGVKDYKKAFDAAEKALAKEGWEVCSPVKVSGDTLREIVGHEVNWIIYCADAMYMLKGWRRSRGARMEHDLADYLGLEIIYQ